MQDNIFWQTQSVTREEREKLNGHKGKVIWLTGLSGSGKSTIAEALDRKLYEEGKHSFVLDGDNLRHGLNNNLGFSLEDRGENIRRVAEVARLMNSAGIIVITGLISPMRKDREIARNICGEENFMEVFVKCSLEECIKRDVKGLYKKALNGEIKEFTGLTSPYEEPENAEIIVDTEKNEIIGCIEKIIYAI